MSVTERELTRRFYAAYQDPRLAVLEGFHPARHAVAFGARLTTAVTYDRAKLARLAGAVAPEVAAAIDEVVQVVDGERFRRLSRRSLSSPLLSIAARPDLDVDRALHQHRRPVVFLDHPRHPGNVGAVIRVGAAAGVAAVAVSGHVDPWSPVVLRSATGLQFAVPVGRTELPAGSGRPIVAVDVGGEPVGLADLRPDTILVIGGERRGLSPAVRSLADRTIGVPMCPGVSSLNLATAVSAVLFSWKAAARARNGSTPW